MDVRRSGSGSIGATNVGRAVGFHAGVVTLCADTAKGALPTVLAATYSGLPWGAPVAGLGAVCGHTFSPFVRFRGGKGVATATGTLLVLAPHALLGATLLFVVVTAGSRMVSLGSLVASAALPVFCWLTGVDGPVLTVALLCGVLIWIRHRDNIARILEGTELPPPTPFR